MIAALSDGVSFIDRISFKVVSGIDTGEHDITHKKGSSRFFWVVRNAALFQRGI